MNRQDYLAVDEIETVIGKLTLTVYEGQLCHLDFGSLADNKEQLLRWAEKYDFPVLLKMDEVQCAETAKQLREYFSGSRTSFSLKLLMKGTDFQQKVWTALADIPYGETRSYKDIAKAVQNPKGVRAIGMANNRNPIPIVVPCHRVIGSNGALIGYGGGISVKKALLELETNGQEIQTIING
ncbi:methylated-DNA--[protein]-cysteine S-methyltransferase [Sporolactobacillus kofuensis]|uniref:Methylated-DNA--protein-cysteine methyltransferase n=1 Tax=Sporolactobacillus kofuensis TaxID=269672 RepID=A0ABW1WH77_9BACL|nr:methylated-DNA--[protein]-cysteine S-methyltransferase [Sporolactobacillus kofuensis]MCO7176886.1 methylated-DNA--[protein]-cysteine S-methyltransferase [Sporolactobacillus kofuensis]